MKRLCLYLLTAWLIAALSGLMGCGSVPDTADLAKLRQQIGALSEAERTQLQRTGRAQIIKDAWKGKSSGMTEHDYVGTIKCRVKSPDGSEEEHAVHDFVRDELTQWINALSEWGSGSADLLNAWFADRLAHWRNEMTDPNSPIYVDPAWPVQWETCRLEKASRLVEFQTEVGNQLDAVDRDTQPDGVSDRTLAYVIVGAIARELLSKGVLVILCALGTEVYCETGDPPTNPLPPPADLPQYPDGDHP